MMKRIFQSISAVLFIPVILLTVGGFPLYQHYCDCSDEYEASIIVADFECGSEDIQQCCSEAPAMTCCSGSEHQDEKHKCGTDGCCDTTFEYLKIDTDFNIPFEQVTFKFFVAFIKIFAASENYSESGIISSREYIDQNIPPPLYGRELLISLHQEKIAPLVV
jgi:hypothetical protein